MKYLKLDARHPECHGLARALVGSRTKENGLFVAFVPHQQFCDWFSFYVIDRIMDGEYWAVSAEMKHECGWGEATAYSEILLPLANLKLCPYVAMREGVRVKGVLRECEWDGTLDECNHGLFTFDTNFEISEITLDLDNLPKGAEIVEDVK